MSKNKHSIEADLQRLSDESFLQRMVRDMKLAFWLFQQREVSLLAKAVPVLVLAYTLAPLDLIPDFIPILGQLDDIALIMLGVRFFLRLAPPQVVGRYEANRRGLMPIDLEP
ncbi:MAG: YkvA family protein [Anaerolineae bacterium]|nr:YkvA family protein [Anaerolineae bacterium]